MDTLAAFLAHRHEENVRRPDLVILAGNAVAASLFTAIRLAKRFGCTLLISGGIGHSTALLAEIAQGSSGLRRIVLDDRSEAGILGAIATSLLGFPQQRLLTENRSTNTGENARFSRSMLEVLGRVPTTVALVQDPLMQRRTFETFRFAWRDLAVTFQSRPPFVPAWRTMRTRSAWSEARFLSLLLGEVPRLRDDAGGYGPNGRGFIGHVDIPERVAAAQEALERLLPSHLGR